MGTWYSSLISTSIQAQRCSTLIPDGPPYLFVRRRRNTHTNSSSSGMDSSTGKGVTDTSMIRPGRGGGTLQYIFTLSVVIRSIATLTGGGGVVTPLHCTNPKSGSRTTSTGEDWKQEGPPPASLTLTRGVNGPPVGSPTLVFLACAGDNDLTDGCDVLPPLCWLGSKSPQRSACSFASPKGVAREWPCTTPQTTVPPGFVSVWEAGGTAGSDQGSGIVPSGQRHRGTLRPCSGQSCAKGPRRIHSIKYGLDRWLLYPHVNKC